MRAASRLATFQETPPSGRSTSGVQLVPVTVPLKNTMPSVDVDSPEGSDGPGPTKRRYSTASGTALQVKVGRALLVGSGTGSSTGVAGAVTSTTKLSAALKTLPLPAASMLETRQWMVVSGKSEDGVKAFVATVASNKVVPKLGSVDTWTR